MGILEIVLLVLGVALGVASFVIPAAKEEMEKESRKLAKEEIKTMVGKEIDSIRQHVDDVVDEAVEYAMEKTERSLERMTNEKIMAVNEYSDTVLQEINKSHEEVMFLYDMLNDKHANIKDTVSEVNRTVAEVTETTREAEAVVNTFQQLKPETVNMEPVEERKVFNFLENKTIAEFEAEAEAANSATPVVMNFAATEEEEVNNNDRILELHKQGKSNVAIAKELGLGVGEVKLVIDLYKNM